MNKRIIKKLAEASFSKNNLSESKVSRISKSLKREDLKVYIKDLKEIEAKKTVVITVPTDLGLSEIKNYFSKLYPGKKLVFTIDEALLTGIKVVHYDNVYELSLKSFLESALGELND